MAKVQMTESQIINLVENATRNALSRILNEGAGWDAVKAGYNAGKNGEIDTPRKGQIKQAIKNGEGDVTTYDNYKRNKTEYDANKKAHERAKSANKDVKKNPNSYSLDHASKSNEAERAAKEKRGDSALQTVCSRPGVIGKAQRAAAIGGTLAGMGAKKVKDAGKNFIHNKIGLEEK